MCRGDVLYNVSVRPINSIMKAFLNATYFSITVFYAVALNNVFFIMAKRKCLKTTLGICSVFV